MTASCHPTDHHSSATLLLFLHAHNLSFACRPRVLELDTAPPPTSSTSRDPPSLRSSRASQAGPTSLQLDSSDDEQVRRPHHLERPQPQPARINSAVDKPRSGGKGKALERHGSSDVEIMDDATRQRPTKRSKADTVDPSDREQTTPASSWMCV